MFWIEVLTAQETKKTAELYARHRLAQDRARYRAEQPVYVYYEALGAGSTSSVSAETSHSAAPPPAQALAGGKS